ncbi:Acetoin utilization deacetylase AcuC [Pseudovibrio denitrificans]|uniref:Acetoin utilization deacetylase AcuC n=2 Tax=Pseudovibrio denitrificans TaxID=258256 RepID=A0A1I7C9V1_9HYPH|nr:Acetoin utilization deacetylase AcuC [Pseudovibrio denitrificans]
MRLPIVHHPAYTADIPEDHRFPMRKYAEVARWLKETDPQGALYDFHEPAPISRDDLLRVHAREYVDQVLSCTVPHAVAREIGFPMTESVSFRAQCATGGSLLTAMLALEHGVACNTAGGSHHARIAQGAGFCVFNDVAVAVRAVQAMRMVRRVLIIDLDVHQGDGTADIFAHDTSVFTLSLHSEKNYPVRKKASTLDVPLEDGMEDDEYLSILEDTLKRVLTTFKADLVFFNAGVDPHHDDRLGRLALSDEGLRKREELVFKLVRNEGLPLAGVLGGGYSYNLRLLVNRHSNLYRVAAKYL